MLTLEQIRDVTFRKAKFGGYMPEDVNDFIDEVLASYESLLQNNAELVRKLEILAKTVEEYREDEESIRTAVMSAQKLGDASIREAKHKAEVILKDASLKAEKIVGGAQNEVKAQQTALEDLKKEVSAFRSRLLSIYKEHLTLIDALPSSEPRAQETPAPEEAPEASTEQPAAPATPAAEAVEPAEPEQTAMPVSFPPEEPAEELAEDPRLALSEEERGELADSMLEEEDALVEAVLQADDSPAEELPQPSAGRFHMDRSSLEGFDADPIPDKPRFGSIKFGENYDISSDNEGESPVGLFRRKSGR